MIKHTDLVARGLDRPWVVGVPVAGQLCEGLPELGMPAAWERNTRPLRVILYPVETDRRPGVCWHKVTADKGDRI